eukprot:4383214-Prymnesium_polylepis.1
MRNATLTPMARARVGYISGAAIHMAELAAVIDAREIIAHASSPLGPRASGKPSSMPKAAESA